jgi:RNA polymerase sigma-70 factor (ECF subfamily)
MTLSQRDILQTLMRARDRIAAAAWVVVRDAHTAEDIFQNVALKAMEKEVDFESEGAVLSWAFITARRDGIDWLRRHRRESAGFDQEILTVLEQEWLSESIDRGDARVRALRHCLDTLPEQAKRLLRLRYFEQHSCAEVASRLGLEVNAVYKRMSRLHRSLEDCIRLRLNDQA